MEVVCLVYCETVEANQIREFNCCFSQVYPKHFNATRNGRSSLSKADESQEEDAEDRDFHDSGFLYQLVSIRHNEPGGISCRARNCRPCLLHDPRADGQSFRDLQPDTVRVLELEVQDHFD